MRIFNASILLMCFCSFNLLGCEETNEIDSDLFGVYENGKLTLQAETATLSGATVSADGSGYQGSGYADLEGRKDSSYVEWTFEMSEAETANIAWYYSNDTGGSVSYYISVNGEVAGGSKSFGDTGSWSNWKKASRKILLPKGTVTVRVYAKSNTSDGVNIDRVEITSDNAFEFDGGSSSDNSSSSNDSSSSSSSSDGSSSDNGSSDANQDDQSNSDWYPCNGSTSGYNATAIKNGNTWTVQNGQKTVYSGSSMSDAIVSAYGSLSSGRKSKESVLIQGDGDVSADLQLRIPSYTVVNVCGTINVTGKATGGDKSPMYARSATNIDIPHVRITGSPVYAMFLRQTNNVRLGQIYLELDAGAGRGLRIDHSSRSAPGKPMNSNYQIDYVYVTGSGGHGVETYGITNISIGEVHAENTGYCGLLLNYTTYAEVGKITGINCGAGTGYAAFRIANQAGNVDDNGSYPEGNIHVGSVYARDGGRGIFLVSDSGGLVIDNVDISNTGSNAILLENAHRVTVAAKTGIVKGPGDVRIAGASENINIKNLTIENSRLRESPCGANIEYSNVRLNNSADDRCN